jgi:BirA family transcriptional regulator, biotin operon repressor / biotin---[acetyl-CoA-carboxylase] ligase
MQEQLQPEAILQGLATTSLPRTIHCYGQVGSTMDLCRAALGSLPEQALPLLVVADEQVAGRGRRGRAWVAPAGTALLFSLALRPQNLAAERAASLVWLASVALCEGIAEATGLQPRLKWPNDLLVPYADQPSWRKAAGILLEVQSTSESVAWAIIGCGINVAASPPLEAVRYPAGNLATSCGGPVERLLLLQAVLRRFDSWYLRLAAGDDEALFARWRSLIHNLGQQVQVETDQGPISGQAEDVERDGALIVRDASGARHRVASGDVALVSSFEENRQSPEGS